MLLLILLLANGGAALVDPTGDRKKTDTVECNENGDCPSNAMDCHKICGCDRSAYAAVYYNETSKTCVVSFKHLMISQMNIYGKDQEESDGTSVDIMAEKIRLEAETIFNTILVSVILFLTCCAICFISACLYCCRMSYSDYILKKDVNALAKKLKRDNINIKEPKKRLAAISESCNVVCEDAGVFVV